MQHWKLKSTAQNILFAISKDDVHILQRPGVNFYNIASIVTIFDTHLIIADRGSSSA